jgi:hypothetical protein
MTYIMLNSCGPLPKNDRKSQKRVPSGDGIAGLGRAVQAI